jgi:hypothetical protein
MKELEQKLLEAADILIKHYDPCQIKGSQCIVSKDNPCCKISCFGTPCPHMKERKCTNPNIECKIWFCETAIKNMDTQCYEAFRGLEHIAKQYNLASRPFLGDTNYVGADK